MVDSVKTYCCKPRYCELTETNYAVMVESDSGIFVKQSDYEALKKDSVVELELIKKGVAEIMENVDEDGWAYAWCKSVL